MIEKFAQWMSLAMLLVACGAPMPQPVCAPGESRACVCTDGRSGAQRCLSSGDEFDRCVCSNPCTPDCSGIVCGPPRNIATCPDTTCGACAIGTHCSAVGLCVRDNSPCDGRTCGVGSDGVTSCGACSAGFTCSSGTCVRATTCIRQPGEPCATHADCCAGTDGTPAFCEDVFGYGRVCTSRCATNANCRTACCARYDDNNLACATTRFCAAETGCTRGINDTCASDDQCCRDPANRIVPTACGCFGSECTCRALCRVNSDCVSGCCAARATDGLRVCASVSACR